MGLLGIFTFPHSFLVALFSFVFVGKMQNVQELVKKTSRKLAGKRRWQEERCPLCQQPDSWGRSWLFFSSSGTSGRRGPCRGDGR